MIKKVEPKEIIDAEYTAEARKDEDTEYLDVKEDFLSDLKSREGYFIWAPSEARNPRASHMAFYGRTYCYKDGAGKDGLLPGEEINCQCGIIELPMDKKNLIGEDVTINPITNIIKIAGTSFKATKSDVKNDKLTASGYKKYKAAVLTGGGSVLQRQKAALDMVYYAGKTWKKISFTEIAKDKYTIPYILYNPSTKTSVTKKFTLTFKNNSKNYYRDQNGLFISRQKFNDIIFEIENETDNHVVSLGGI